MNNIYFNLTKSMLIVCYLHILYILMIQFVTKLPVIVDSNRYGENIIEIILLLFISVGVWKYGKRNCKDQN